MNDEYEVGYAKPPKDTQFKKGQSGNPKGRPKQITMSLEEVFQHELQTKICVTESGERIEISKAQAIAKTMINEAIKGSPRMLKEVLSIVPSKPRQQDVDNVRIYIPDNGRDDPAHRAGWNNQKIEMSNHLYSDEE